jgi:indoleamine 2,3-dioxygenase
MMQHNFERGFMPVTDPVDSLGEPFFSWESFGREVSKLALTRYIRQAVEELPPFPYELLDGTAKHERAMNLLSFIANLYVFAPEHPVATRLPANLAVAWHAVAGVLRRPPVLSYASQTLFNWRRIDPAGPVAVGNLVMLQNFLGGMDEEWFATIHMTIEAAAGPGLAALLPAQAAVQRNDVAAVEQALITVAKTLQTIQGILQRMPERCDPYIYYHRVRPYMFGWKQNPLLPNGMIYEGVAAYGGLPQQFRGETGAQSSVIYAFDALLGIEHEFDAMRAYLLEMRDYMPVQDRAFIEQLEHGPNLRAYVLARKASHPSLRDAYNACIERLGQFRQLHIEYAATYIIKPGQGTSDVGTGGTPFTVYLKKHIRETEKHRV